MKRWDLIVIGTGLAGLTAARTAVEMGARVLIVGRGMGSLALFGNTIDVLGAVPPGVNLETGVADWIAAHPDHPYARTGWAGIAEALVAFRELFPPPYSFVAAGTSNSLVPTGAGTLRPTYLLPVTMRAGAGIAAAETLIVGFRGFKDFQGDTVSLHLGVPRGEHLPSPLRPGGAERPRPRTADGRGAVPNRPRRGDPGPEGRRKTDRPPRRPRPPRTGRGPGGPGKGDRRTGLRDPDAPPSIPGLRIFNRFRERLIAKGATFLMGNPVTGATVKDGRCEGITICNPPLETEYRAESYILATGRFLGGGLWADMDRITEPLFHLPVSQPATRGDWFRERFFQSEAHPIHCAGIVTDAGPPAGGRGGNGPPDKRPDSGLDPGQPSGDRGTLPRGDRNRHGLSGREGGART